MKRAKVKKRVRRKPLPPKCRFQKGDKVVYAKFNTVVGTGSTYGVGVGPKRQKGVVICDPVLKNSRESWRYPSKWIKFFDMQVRFNGRVNYRKEWAMSESMLEFEWGPW